MATKKVIQPKAEAKKEETKKPNTITVDGKQVKPEGVFSIDEKGEYHRANPTDVLEHNLMAITLMNKDGFSKTVGIHWRKTEEGYYVFKLGIANGMKDETVDKSKVNLKDDLTLIGRGSHVDAHSILEYTWRAFGEQFGIEKAYCLVRVELAPKTKEWKAIFAPVTDVLVG